MNPGLREYWVRFLETFKARTAGTEEELRFHLEMAEQEALRRGAPVREARLNAGGLSQASDALSDQRTIGWLRDFLQDARHGARLLAKSPGFAAAAVLSLALGIGANTAIFSVVNAVLLRPLAYREPDRLVTILHHGELPVAPANYYDWRKQSHSFEAMGAAEWWQPNLIGTDIPEHLFGLRLTESLLPLLGVQPLLGRWFLSGDDQAGSEHEVILSYGLWQRHFHGDRGVLGSDITLDGARYTIVGVMPRAFKFAPFWATRAELWAPLALGERIHDRTANSLRVFARLAPGVTITRARAEIAAITARLDQQYPATNRDVVVTPLKEKVVGNVELPLLILMAAVGLVLLIACANVSHMLLARAANRHREMALRTALGAGRTRVVRQFLAESLLLAATGCAAGFLLALWGTRALIALSPADLPRLDTAGIDLRVVLFTLGITALTGLASGLAPALAISADLTGALKEGERGSSERFGRNRMRSVLVASEFALALMLLIGAVLMIRSFGALQSIDPGFDPRNLLSMIVSVKSTQESEPARRAIFYRQVVNRIRALPGVRAASAINHLPLGGDLWVLPFTIEGRPKPLPGAMPIAVYRIAMPGYFEAMRLPLLRGRGIQPSDDRHSPGVAVINERAAGRYWRGEDPIGKRIAFGPDWFTIVGIVKDAKQSSNWTAEILPEVYLAALQNRGLLGEQMFPDESYITLVVRTAGDPAAMSGPVQNAVRSFDRNLPISDIVTMNEVLAQENARPRFEMLVLGIFAGIALLLAAVGIYGVMSYSVSRRTHEIGIRLSLGAGRGSVLRMVFGQGMLLALCGSVAGLAGSLVLSHAMKGLLYGVRPFDPVTFLAVAAALCLVALVSIAVPARRATKVDPLITLRAE